MDTGIIVRSLNNTKQISKFFQNHFVDMLLYCTFTVISINEILNILLLLIL